MTLKRMFAGLFILLIGIAAAIPQAPALNYYSVAKHKFGFWFIAEEDRTGSATPNVQYSLEVIHDSSGWFRPFQPVVVVPGSVISFESVYGDGQEVFTRNGFARIVAEYITPAAKDNHRPRGWASLRPIQF